MVREVVQNDITKKKRLLNNDEFNLILDNFEKGKPIEYEGCIIPRRLNLAKANQDDKIVDSSIIFNSCTFEQPLSLSGFQFKNKVSFVNSIFKGEVDFVDSDFRENATFSGSRFERHVSFTGDNFGGDVKFIETKFKEYASFVKTCFKTEVNFKNSNFKNEADFGGARFEKGAIFEASHFENDADFTDSYYGGKVSFEASQFEGTCNFDRSRFDSITDFSKSHFKGDASYVRSHFEEDIDFSGSHFKGQADFRVSQFERRIRFALADKEKTRFYKTLNLDYCMIYSMNIDAEFRGISRRQISLQYPHLNRLFTRWGSIENNIEYNSSAYLALINNYKNLGWFEDADKCYYEYRKLDQSKKEKMDYSKIADLISWMFIGYGVKIWRVILWIFGSISIFAILYRLFNAIEPVNSSITSLSLISCLYFSTMVLSGQTPINMQASGYWIYAVMLERILGYFLLALFIVVMTRKLIR